MSKGLEAFNKIYEQAYFGIETDAPELLDWLKRRKEIVEKELKAFELIKNKEIDIHYFKDLLRENYADEIFLEVHFSKYKLSIEDIKLLREVLTNEIH